MNRILFRLRRRDGLSNKDANWSLTPDSRKARKLAVSGFQDLVQFKRTKAALNRALPTSPKGDVESICVLLNRAEQSSNSFVNTIQGRLDKLAAVSGICTEACKALKKKLRHPREKSSEEMIDYLTAKRVLEMIAATPAF